jgi:hypothetical protein
VSHGVVTVFAGALVAQRLEAWAQELAQGRDTAGTLTWLLTLMNLACQGETRISFGAFRMILSDLVLGWNPGGSCSLNLFTSSSFLVCRIGEADSQAILSSDMLLSSGAHPPACSVSAYLGTDSCPPKS